MGWAGARIVASVAGLADFEGFGPSVCVCVCVMKIKMNILWINTCSGTTEHTWTLNGVQEVNALPLVGGSGFYSDPS